MHHFMLSLTVTAGHDAVDASPVAERWFWVGELQMAIEVTMELVTSGHGHPYFLLWLKKRDLAMHQQIWSLYLNDNDVSLTLK